MIKKTSVGVECGPVHPLDGYILKEQCSVNCSIVGRLTKLLQKWCDRLVVFGADVGEGRRACGVEEGVVSVWNVLMSIRMRASGMCFIRCVFPGDTMFGGDEAFGVTNAFCCVEILYHKHFTGGKKIASIRFARPLVLL